MAPPRSAIIKAFNDHRHPTRFAWAGKWIADVEWASYLSIVLFDVVDAAALNKALGFSMVLSSCFQSQAENTEGIYRHTVRIDNNRRMRFYYVSRVAGEVPSFSPDPVEWKNIFDNNKIIRSKRRKRQQEGTDDDDDAGEEEQRQQQNEEEGESNEGGQQPAIITPDGSSASRHFFNSPDSGVVTNNSQSQSACPDFFDDKRVAALFNGSHKTIGSTRKKLELWIETLIEAERDFGKLEKLVNKTDECAIEPYQVANITCKALYLRRAYEKALQEMPRGMTWIKCCESVIQTMADAGFSGIKNGRTLSIWSRYFRENTKFPHPNVYVELGIVKGPKLFQILPEAKNKFVDWCNANLVELTGGNAANFIREELLPGLFAEEMAPLPEEDRISFEQFKKRFNLTTVTDMTALNWFHHMDFKYSATTKCYYNDKHENEENRAFRPIFSNDYFKYERLSYRWVQVPVEDAIALENETDKKKRSFPKFGRSNLPTLKLERPCVNTM